jgi:hypothetical protein
MQMKVRCNLTDLEFAWLLKAIRTFRKAELKKKHKDIGTGVMRKVTCASNDRVYRIENAKVLRETERALYVDAPVFGGMPQWIPRSQVEEFECGVLVVTQWLARKKGWVGPVVTEPDPPIGLWCRGPVGEQ